MTAFQSFENPSAYLFRSMAEKQEAGKVKGSLAKQSWITIEYDSWWELNFVL
jgi:hypothetical protein